MAEHQHLQQQQHGRYGQAQLHGDEGMLKGLTGQQGPSGSKVAAVATLFPIGGILLLLSGLTLTGTVLGLAVLTPLLVIFSPVLVPAAAVLGLAVLGFLTSGALGLTGVTSLTWIVSYVRGAAQRVPEQLEHARRRALDAAGQVGQRTKETGQQIQARADRKE